MSINKRYALIVVGLWLALILVQGCFYALHPTRNINHQKTIHKWSVIISEIIPE